jgi:hypothetical protein
MDLVAAGLAVTVGPLFVGSVAVIHDLRRTRHDIRTSVLIAGGIWMGIVVGTKLLVTLLVSPICVR